MFDPQRRAESGELRAALKCLIAFLELREAGLGVRKRARREADRKSFGLAVEAIACNLAVLRLTDPGRPSQFLAAAALCGQEAATAILCTASISSMCWTLWRVLKSASSRSSRAAIASLLAGSRATLTMQFRVQSLDGSARVLRELFADTAKRRRRDRARRGRRLATALRHHARARPGRARGSFQDEGRRSELASVRRSGPCGGFCRPKRSEWRLRANTGHSPTAW
jgi:hypothetical protein